MRKLVLFTLLGAIGMACAESAPMNVEDFLFTVECADGSRGSAFLMQDDDGIWMVSNYHVISGMWPAKFVSMSNSDVELTLPDHFEIAKDRDAIRFKVSYSNGFPVATSYSFDDQVSAFGNSRGLGVITKNKGEIVGKGDCEIEVSCEIVEGNSGGPLINASNQVLGIATYIVRPESANDLLNRGSTKLTSSTEGTRYAQFRRFAIPLSGLSWQPVDGDSLKKEQSSFEKYMDEAKTCGSVITLMCNKISVRESAGELLLEGRAIRKYNREIAYRRFSRYARKVNDPRRTIKSHHKLFKELVDGAREWSEEFKESIQSDFHIEYFSNALCESAELVDKEVDRIARLLK